MTNRTGPFIVGLFFIAATFGFLGWAGAGLAVIAVIAVAIQAARETPPQTRQHRRRLITSFALTLLWQTLHLIEEWITGFATAFPALLGAPAWTDGSFLGLNLIILVACVVALFIIALSHHQGLLATAIYVAIFLAIAAIANGVAHPLMAVMANDGRWYFPGLMTGICHLYFGIRLMRDLRNV